MTDFLTDISTVFSVKTVTVMIPDIFSGGDLRRTSIPGAISMLIFVRDWWYLTYHVGR